MVQKEYTTPLIYYLYNTTIFLIFTQSEYPFYTLFF